MSTVNKFYPNLVAGESTIFVDDPPQFIKDIISPSHISLRPEFGIPFIPDSQLIIGDPIELENVLSDPDFDLGDSIEGIAAPHVDNGPLFYPRAEKTLYDFGATNFKILSPVLQDHWSSEVYYREPTYYGRPTSEYPFAIIMKSSTEFDRFSTEDLGDGEWVFAGQVRSKSGLLTVRDLYNYYNIDSLSNEEKEQMYVSTDSIANGTSQAAAIENQGIIVRMTNGRTPVSVDVWFSRDPVTGEVVRIAIGKATIRFM